MFSPPTTQNVYPRVYTNSCTVSKLSLLLKVSNTQLSTPSLLQLLTELIKWCTHCLQSKTLSSPGQVLFSFLSGLVFPSPHVFSLTRYTYTNLCIVHLTDVCIFALLILLWHVSSILQSWRDLDEASGRYWRSAVWPHLPPAVRGLPTGPLRGHTRGRAHGLSVRPKIKSIRARSPCPPSVLQKSQLDRYYSNFYIKEKVQNNSDIRLYIIDNACMME